MIAVLAVAVIVISAPLRRRSARAEDAESPERAELEAAKEAKYREIRDAELDHRMGKLSERDWRGVDGELRGEAVEILRELDVLEGREPG